MKKGKILLCLLIAAFMLLAAACGGQSGEQSSGTEQTSGEKITLKIAHVVDPSHHYQIGAENFKKIVEERTNGRVEVQIFPSSQLGNERAILEGMKMGSIEMGVITSGALSGFVPEYAVLDLGYLFKDVDEAMNVLNGPIGEEFSQKMVDNGIRNLGTLRYGFRSVYAGKPINSPEDLKGMKIRTMENPAHMDCFKALGANPTPMGYGELYTALQQKVVDGAENLPDLFYNSKHYEVAKEYSMTNHVYCIVMWMMSEKVYQSLPEDLRPIIMEAAQESIEYENGVIVEQMNQAKANLEAAGVKITEPDIAPFQEAVKESWAETVKSIPNGQAYLDKIMEATGQK